MADDLAEMINDAVVSTEKEVLAEAFSDEPVKEETPQQETQDAQPEAKDENRDPATGRYIPKADKADKDAKDAKADEGQPEAPVPSGRLREEAALRRAAEAERDALRDRFEALERRLAGLEKPQREQPKPEEIDPLLDPQGFAKRLEDGFASRLREIQLNNNLSIAHVRHGEKFEKAYSALLAEGQRGNRQLVNALMSQANPGEAMVKWFTDQEVLREVGSDPATYKNKLLEEALKDPAFLNKAIETARAAAGQKPNAPRVELPPSLSKASGSSKNVDPIDTDGSEKAVFDYAFK